MPGRNITILFLAAILSLLCYAEAARNRYAGILSESIDKISRYYVKPVEPRRVFEGGMEGMLNALDPYSGYISPEQLAQFRVDIEQRFVGVGIEVGMENDQLTVLSPIPGSPAFKAGLIAGDVIVKINGESTEDLSLLDAVERMRGQPGSMVTMSIERPGVDRTLQFQIERSVIQVGSVRGDRRNPDGSWQFTLEDYPRIGYVQLTGFGDRTSEELRDTLRQLDDRIDALILDLRGNAGGLLTAAVEVCDLFLPADKLVVSTRGRDARQTRRFVSQQPALVDPNMPIVVLTDRFSASASEIVAACLQDYGRATVVGERTFGKGTVQNVIEIEGGRSAIRLTTQTYWRPSGENIHRHVEDTEEDPWGVTPHDKHLLELTDDQYRDLIRLRRERTLAGLSTTDQPRTDTSDEQSDAEQDSVEQDSAEQDSAEQDSAEQDSAEQDSAGVPNVMDDPHLKYAIEFLLEKLQDPRKKAASLDHVSKRDAV